LANSELIRFSLTLTGLAGLVAESDRAKAAAADEQAINRLVGREDQP
jgi:hypothetical protein